MIWVFEMYTIVVIALVAIVGALYVVILLRKNSQEEQFAKEFFLQLMTYINSHGSDFEAYNWLIRRSTKMQKQMGGFGILASYARAHSSRQYLNYQVILNMLPALNRSYAEPLSAISGTSLNYAKNLHECMVRYLGVLEDRQEMLFAELKNPIICFRNGVSLVVGIPVRVVGWLGLISSEVVRSILSARAFKFISGVVALIGLVSSIIGIATGWGQFLVMIQKIPFVAQIISLIKI